MSGRKSQNKGRRGEYEVRDIYAAHGIPVRLHGIYEPGDLTIYEGTDHQQSVEVKNKKLCHAEIYKALEDWDILWHKSPRKQWIVSKKALDHLEDECAAEFGAYPAIELLTKEVA
jgi:hypothetical protein